MSGALAKYTIVRVAGLPWNSLDALDFHRARTLEHAIEELEAWLDGSRVKLCEALFGAVSRSRSEGVRARLIDLKRAVFNMRAAPLDDVRGADLSEEPDLASALALFADNARRLAALREELVGAFRADSMDVRAKLSLAWAEPDFQAGVLMAQPRLLSHLLEYLSSGADAHEKDKKLRHTETAALAYFIRMATKTSPFSTFTITGIGFLDASLGAATFRVGESSSRFRVSAALAQELAHALQCHPHARTVLPARLNDSLVAAGTEWLVLHRTDETQNGPGRRESVSTIQRTPLLDAFVEKLSRTGPEIANVLGKAIDSAFEGRVSSTAISRFMDTLFDTGIIELCLDWAANDPAALAKLADLIESRFPALQDASMAARAVAQATDSLPSFSPAERVPVLDEVERLVSLVSAEVGRPNATGRNHVHEARFFDETVRVPAEPLDRAAAVFRKLSRAMPAFNSGCLLQFLARDYFTTSFGVSARVPLTVFVAAFYRDRYEPLARETFEYLPDPFARVGEWSRLGEIQEMASARRDFIGALAAVADPHSSAIELDGAFFDDWVNVAVKYTRPDVELSVGFFAQPFRRGSAELGMAINYVVPGYGTYFAPHCDERCGAAGSERLRTRVAEQLRRAAGDARFAEILATFGFDGQVHLPLTDHCIAYPGEPVSPNGSSLIPWHDLIVEYDDHARLLVLTADSIGRRVLPLSLGPLSPHLMPSTYRILASLGPSLVPDFNPLDMLDGAAPRTTEVRHYPRLSLDGVVIMRESFRIPQTLLPRDLAGLGDVAGHARLRHWRHGLGLPRHAFVIPFRMSDLLYSAVRNDPTPARLPRLYKPFYVDFDNPMSCRLFDRFCHGVEADLTVTEMLPTAEQLVVQGDGGAFHVAELLVETYVGSAT